MTQSTQASLFGDSSEPVAGAPQVQPGVQTPYVGCSRWQIPKPFLSGFPPTGTHLQRYAARFNAVEITSAFHQSHEKQTYAKWARSVPHNFRFVVKVPQHITHEQGLRDVATPLRKFVEEVSGLGHNLGALLLQLPPDLPLRFTVVHQFLTVLREVFVGNVVCEPRHRSWFSPEAEELMLEYRIARAAVDPAINEQASIPGGWDGLAYYRLHGSPERYVSPYSKAWLKAVADALNFNSEAGKMAYCIFNNVAADAAIVNAIELQQFLRQRYAVRMENGANLEANQGNE